MNPKGIMLRIYVGCFIAALAIVVVVFASALLRQQGFPVVHWLWSVAIPSVLKAAWSDPLYILAAILVAALLWCLPYEAIWEWISEAGEDEPDDENSHVRRGSHMTSSSRANQRAYEELTRDIAQRQRNRRRRR